MFHTEFNESYPILSPDNEWLAFQSDQSGQAEVYLQPSIVSGGECYTVSTGGGRFPVWSRDGRELFYVSSTHLMAVPVRPGSVLELGTPVPVLDVTGYAMTVGWSFDVADDGQFLMIKPRSSVTGASPAITVVANWFEELKRLVPIP